MTLSDQELRARLVAGDEDALAAVYDRFAGLVIGLARRVTGTQEAAQEVAQEVFVHLWERPHAFDPERGSLSVWLGTLAHRRAVDWVRRDSRWRRAGGAQEAQHDTQPGVEEEVVANDMARSVREAVTGLSPPLREAIELAYYQGRTYREVAAALRLPEGTAKSRIRSALARIGQELERNGVTG